MLTSTRQAMGAWHMMWCTAALSYVHGLDDHACGQQMRAACHIEHRSVCPGDIPVRRLWAWCLATCLGLQLFEQRRRLLQIRRVKALGKPLVHRRQQVVGVLALVLGLPQARQAGGGAQLPGLGLLVTGHVEGLLETGFRLRRIRHRLLQQQGPLEPIQLSRVVTASVVSTTASASASAVNPSSGCPPAPYASASRPREYGWNCVDPVARSAASPCRIAARPASPSPCMARAQPCRTVLQATRCANPCAVARLVAATACSCTAR